MHKSNFFLRPKKRILFFLLLLPLLQSCTDDSEDTVANTNDPTVETLEEATSDETELNNHDAPSIVVPEGYEIISESYGDLDGDGVSDMVVVFNTDRTGEFGTEREIRLYSKDGDRWALWETINGPVLPSDAGGMMGDPFEEAHVLGGDLIVSHFGGSADKWSYTHEYKLVDDEWRVIAATLVFYRNCDYSETYLYDLAKGTLYHTRQRDKCNDNGESVENRMELEESLSLTEKQGALMKDFVPGKTEVSVNENETIYFY